MVIHGPPIRGDILNQFKDQGNKVRGPKIGRRLAILAIACMIFILCGMSVSAARTSGRHKGLSRLNAGLNSVKLSAKKARLRLIALKKREDILTSKIEEAQDEPVADEGDGSPSTICFAKVELAKIRYEKKALTRKLRTCELNKKCILAEIEVVSEVAPADPLEEDIQFIRPIRGRITSGFGMRLHPLEHIEKPHQGIDLAGEIGDPVKSTANGRVIFAGIQRGYGKIVIIQHSEELASAYGHLSVINVEVGEAVARGQRIGEVGMTGNSTGPHLHFEIRENGEQVNPSKYI